MFNIDQAFWKRLGIYMIGVFFGIIIAIYYVSVKSEEVKLKKGMTIPEIAQPDQNGNIIHREDLKGNLVLLDFWASWCPTCRGTNVELKYLYKAYHDKVYKNAKNFEIVSISFDDSKEDWLKAMVKDSIEWLSLKTIHGAQDSIKQRYGIKELPVTILIDSNGVILAKTTNIDAIKFGIEQELAK